jgi:CRISPR-associated endoribonuclease Cas6
MRIKIKFTQKSMVLIPWDYQYAIQAWIYKVIDNADSDLAILLHDHGYKYAGKSFKLFSFGQWEAPYEVESKVGMRLKTDHSTLTIGFLLPDVLKSFISGLFIDQSHTFFFKGLDPVEVYCYEVTILQPLDTFSDTKSYELTTGARISLKTENNKYPQYIGPEHPEYITQVVKNLVNKYQASLTQENQVNLEMIQMEVIRIGKTQTFNISKDKNLIQMKGYKYTFNLTAPEEIHNTLYYAGLGEECSLGLGWVEELTK